MISNIMNELLKKDTSRIPIFLFFISIILILMASLNNLPFLPKGEYNLGIFKEILMGIGVFTILLTIVLLVLPMFSKVIPLFENKNYNVEKQGALNLSNLTNIKRINTLFKQNNLDRLYIKDLPKYFENFIKSNVNKAYIKDDYDTRIKDDITKFIIQYTRLSTFICFTDGEQILLFDRRNNDKKKINVENLKYDCFGSVGFENSSIRLKILNPEFYESEILKIEFIPGIAYEDNVGSPDNQTGIETAIMFGYIMYLSKEDIVKAVLNSDSKVLLFPINSKAINIDNLTSKSQLAIDFLKNSDNS